MDNQKTAILTASYSGIGYEVSRILVSKGCRLVVINHDVQKTEKFMLSLKQEFHDAEIDAFYADLSNHDEIRQVTSDINNKYEIMHYLFHVAGVLSENKQMSIQGNELQFEVNTVAPYLLTTLLKPLLSKNENAVVVTSGSGIRQMPKSLELESLQNPTKFKKMTGSYAQSKLAVSTAFEGMRSEYAKTKIRLWVIDLMPVKTAMSLNKGVPLWMRVFRPLFLSPQKAAQKLVAVAFSDPSTEQKLNGKPLPDVTIQNQLIKMLEKITQQRDTITDCS